MKYEQIMFGKLSDFNDDAYDYDDSTEAVLFRCNECWHMVDGFIRHGIYVDAECDNCGATV